VTSGEFEISLIEDKVSELAHISSPNESAGLPHANVCPISNSTFEEENILYEFIEQSNFIILQKVHSRYNSTNPNYLDHELTGNVLEELGNKLIHHPSQIGHTIQVVS